MENNLDNALKYVRDIDSIDEGWSESEKTLALYMVNYAEEVSKNESIGHVSKRSELLNTFGMKLAERCMITGGWTLNMEDFVKEYERNL